MKPVTLSEIVSSTSGSLVAGDKDSLIDSVTTDTRKASSGGAFFALRGERFDAHDFLDAAVAAGASVLVVERQPEGLDVGNAAILLVEDTLKALQDFAKWYRTDIGVTVVGITGSNGKTSTKDFTRDVLSVAFKVSATVGNLNNHIGLPLSVLSAEEDDDICIWEMGMNHPGEIAPLCEIASPNIGIITNVGTAHIEFMGSRDAIALEKGALAESLPSDGVLFVPADCDYADSLSARTAASSVLIGDKDSLIRAENIVIEGGFSYFDLVSKMDGRAAIQLPVMGKHMVTNALLAAAVGLHLKMSVDDIAQGLSDTQLTSGRLRTFESRGVSIFDDTYNANLESVSAALETLAEVNSEGVKVAVLGKMAELGEHTETSHRTVGALAANLGLKLVSVGEGAEQISTGAKASGGDAVHCSTIEDAAQRLKVECRSGDVVLFKGSRSAGMERVMNQVFPKI